MIRIGEKIRNLRLQNGLTQAELANRADLSKGYISQVESEQVSLSLYTLENILLCLGTNFKEFFSEEEPESFIYTDDDVVIKEFAEQGYSISWLVSDSQKHLMEPILLKLEAGRQTEVDDPHDGEEFGYVLLGSIDLILQGKRYRVRKGESFYFKPQTPHSIRNAGRSCARILWVSSPPSF